MGGEEGYLLQARQEHRDKWGCGPGRVLLESGVVVLEERLIERQRGAKEHEAGWAMNATMGQTHHLSLLPPHPVIFLNPEQEDGSLSKIKLLF